MDDLDKFGDIIVDNGNTLMEASGGSIQLLDVVGTLISIIGGAMKLFKVAQDITKEMINRDAAKAAVAFTAIKFSTRYGIEETYTSILEAENIVNNLNFKYDLIGKWNSKRYLSYFKEKVKEVYFEAKHRFQKAINDYVGKVKHDN
ncbi:UNVERIFIED_CONTAM: hypothetical protein O8I53_08260 [Campylobacter lari]